MKFIRDIIAEKKSGPPTEDLLDDLEDFLDDAAAETLEPSEDEFVDEPEESPESPLSTDYDDLTIEAADEEVAIDDLMPDPVGEFDEDFEEPTESIGELNIEELTKTLEAQTVSEDNQVEADKKPENTEPKLFSGGEQEPSANEPVTAQDTVAGNTNEDQSSIAVPSPAEGRASNRSGRVKTRILGFNANAAEQQDPIEKASQSAAENTSPSTQNSVQFPAGWLVIIDGPGRGASFTVCDGFSQIGRGEDQAIRINFGDNSISRQNHAAIAYDGEQRSFFLGHGGKTNLVRINGQPVMSTEQLNSDDTIRIGETTLRFVAFCGEDFTWADNNSGAEYAAAL
ncbi:MAG: FHA domain-containing protein [Pseudomonadota bacterium]